MTSRRAVQNFLRSMIMLVNRRQVLNANQAD